MKLFSLMLLIPIVSLAQGTKIIPLTPEEYKDRISLEDRKTKIQKEQDQLNIDFKKFMFEFKKKHAEPVTLYFKGKPADRWQLLFSDDFKYAIMSKTDNVQYINGLCFADTIQIDCGEL